MTADYVESPDQPWLQAATIAWLGEVLEPHWTVLETGCGGSTVFFARRVKKVISYEHNDAWYAKVKGHLKRMHLSQRVEQRFVKMYPTAGLEVKGFPLPEIDLALIDGRGRVKSVHGVMPHIRAGGWLVLDDSQREQYYPAVELLDEQWGSERMIWMSGINHTYAWRKPE